MGFVKDIIGLAIITFAWTNPVGADIIVRALLFILGFEFMSLLVKVGILALSVLFPIFGLLPVFLGALFVLEVLLKFLITGLIFSLIFRPIILVVASFLISHAALPSTLVGIADFALILFGTRFKI